MVVKVINLSFKISKEQIELFFESRKKSGSGSDDLDKVDYDKVVYFVIVWFKNFEGQLKNVGIVKLVCIFGNFIFEYLNYRKVKILKMLNIIRYR